MHASFVGYSWNIQGIYFYIQYSRNIIWEYSPEFHRELFWILQEYIMGIFREYSTNIYLPSKKILLSCLCLSDLLLVNQKFQNVYKLPIFNYTGMIFIFWNDFLYIIGVVFLIRGTPKTSRSFSRCVFYTIYKIRIKQFN